MSKKIFFTVLLIITCLFIYNFNILKYGYYQGYGQLKLIYESKKIEDVLLDKKLNLQTRNNLLLVGKIKQFAIDSLHLKSTENFTRVYIPEKDTITLSVINASYQLELKNYLWHYPIIGDAPYKGFFNKKMLQNEIKSLSNQALDIDVGNVQAWSTLGWFKDPLMGSMLHENVAELSSTIIHELFHATVFVKGEAELNENLAEFVGEEGAKYFLRNTKEYKFSSSYFDERNKKNEAFNLYIHQCTKRLNALYSSTLSNNKKLIEKDKLLFRFCTEIFQMNLFSKEKNRLICNRILHSKNAFFTAFLTYNAKDKRFKDELKFKFNNDIRQFINYYKSKYQQ